MKLRSIRVTASTLALCLFSLGLGLGLSAANAADAPKLQSVQAQIKSIDQDHHTLVVVDNRTKAEQKYQWNEQTKFASGPNALAAKDLKVGEHAVLRYEVGQPTPLLKSLNLLPARAAAPAPASKATPKK